MINMNGKICAFAFFVLSLSICQNAYAKPVMAKIEYFVGDLKITRDGKTIKPKLKLKLYAGDRVKSGMESQAVLIDRNGSLFKINEATDFQLQAHEYSAKKKLSKIKVKVGKVFFNIKKLREAGTKYLIATPTATASIRGTEFSVNVSTSGVSQFLLLTGSMGIMPVGGSQSAALVPGKKATVATGDKNAVVTEMTQQEKSAVAQESKTTTDIQKKAAATQAKKEAPKKEAAEEKKEEPTEEEEAKEETKEESTSEETPSEESQPEESTSEEAAAEEPASEQEPAWEGDPAQAEDAKPAETTPAAIQKNLEFQSPTDTVIVDTGLVPLDDDQQEFSPFVP